MKTIVNENDEYEDWLSDQMQTDEHGNDYYRFESKPCGAVSNPDDDIHY